VASRRLMITPSVGYERLPLRDRLCQQSFRHGSARIGIATAGRALAITASHLRATRPTPTHDLGHDDSFE
jgi:hypothetical protein